MGFKNLPRKFINWLRSGQGFWFPIFAKTIAILHTKTSICACINVCLSFKSGKPIPRVTEFYQFIIFIVGLVWIALIHLPIPILSNPLISKTFGVFLALYRPYEIVLFALYRVFVSESEYNPRCSLAGLILNLFEFGVFFTISYILLGCFENNFNHWSALDRSIKSIFTIGYPVGLNGSIIGAILKRIQFFVSWFFIILVIANAVGVISYTRYDRRSNKKLKQSAYRSRTTRKIRF